VIFGKIEYLNLLPFHTFMKRFTKGSSQKMSMHFKKGVPANINQKFLTRRVDAAFISSIKARRFSNIGLGIIAKKEVLSVLVIPGDTRTNDKESATSNILAQVLGIQGEVLIGDKALKYYLTDGERIDLAKVWHDKHQLPFVFALLCYHKDQKLYKRIKTNFLRSKVKIPQYILQEASQRTGIEKKEILHYLEYISYEVDLQAKRGLKKFYQKVDNL